MLTTSSYHHTFIILYICISPSYHRDILPSSITRTRHQLLLLLRLLGLTQLLQTLLIEEPYLVKELLAPLLEYLLLLLLFVLGAVRAASLVSPVDGTLRVIFCPSLI